MTTTTRRPAPTVVDELAGDQLPTSGLLPTSTELAELGPGDAAGPPIDRAITRTVADSHGRPYLFAAIGRAWDRRRIEPRPRHARAESARRVADLEAVVELAGTIVAEIDSPYDVTFGPDAYACARATSARIAAELEQMDLADQRLGANVAAARVGMLGRGLQIEAG